MNLLKMQGIFLVSSFIFRRATKAQKINANEFKNTGLGKQIFVEHQVSPS